MQVEKVIENIKNTKKIENIRDVFWQAFYGEKCDTSCSNIRIAILNTPCNGFGDVVFAMKLVDYLKKWYNCDIIVATTYEQAFITLGMDKKYIIKLRSSSEKSKKYIQCRRMTNLKMYTLDDQPIHEELRADLYFVAPLQADQGPLLRDVQKLVPSANKLNTFWFSEYNSGRPKDYQFLTGVGNKQSLGLFLRDVDVGAPYELLKNPYAVCYIQDFIDNHEYCLLSFIGLIVKKYKNIDILDIVVPAWGAESLSKNKREKFLHTVGNLYDKIIIKSKKGEIILRDIGSDRQLTIRGDIYPVPNEIMQKIIKYSLKDILVTGDQSITDVLSCCPDKNIFYQIAPWKTTFAKHLSKEMPNNHIRWKRTSCGSPRALKYDSNYREFLQKWDFRKLGKPKIDAVILSTLAIKEDSVLRKIADIILGSGKLTIIKTQVKKMIEY